MEGLDGFLPCNYYYASQFSAILDWFHNANKAWINISISIKTWPTNQKGSEGSFQMEQLSIVINMESITGTSNQIISPLEPYNKTELINDSFDQTWDNDKSIKIKELVKRRAIIKSGQVISRWHNNGRYLDECHQTWRTAGVMVQSELPASGGHRQRLGSGCWRGRTWGFRAFLGISRLHGSQHYTGVLTCRSTNVHLI